MNRNIFQIIYPFLDKLSLGRTLRNIIYWLWKITAVVYGIFALYLIFQILSNAHDFGNFLLGIIACILIVIAWWIIAQIYFYRADKVKNLEDSDFTVIPIIAQMLRLAGEVLAAMIVIIALLITLVGGRYLGLQNLDFLPLFNEIAGGRNNSIVGLLLIIVVAIVYAFWVLIIFYFLAELLSVGVTIAHNSMAIRKMLMKGVAPPPAVESFEEEMVREPPKPVELRCDNCNNVVSPDDAFCMHCGNKLK